MARTTDLLRSAARFSWSGAVFTAQRAIDLLTGDLLNGGRQRPRLFSSIDAVTFAAQGQLGQVAAGLFQAGDELGREWLDLMAEATSSPSGMRRAFAAAQEQATDLAGIARVDGVGKVARQELRNKFEVYWLVRGVRKKLDLPPAGEPIDLIEFVARAQQLDDFAALWAVEGLSHDFTAWHLSQEPSPEGLLTGFAEGQLPEISLPMLHAGLGMAIAEHLLMDLSPRSPRAEVSAALDRFEALCRANCQPAYLETALESLGLLTRCFFPDLTSPLDAALLARQDPWLRQLYWHGVGRAFYFLPVQFIPGYGSVWHAVKICRREVPDALADHHAMAGLGYAFCLVNMAQPEILEHLLLEHGESLRGSSFTEGLVASLLMRHRMTPGSGLESTLVDDLLDHQPAAAVAELWQELLVRPFESRLASGSTELYSPPRAVTAEP